MKKTLISTLLLVLALTLTATLRGESPQTIEVSLQSHLDEHNVVTHDSMHVAHGSLVSMDGALDDNEEYAFAFWIVNGHVRKHLDLKHEFVVRSTMNMEAIFTPSDKHAVVFMDTNGELLKVDYVADGEDATPPDTEELGKPGYILSENAWDGSYENINENKVLTTQYIKDTEDTFTVDVLGGDGGGEYDFNETITLTATEEDFSYWIIGNRIVSYEETYTFTVMDDVTVEAIYGEGPPKTDEPFVSVSDPLTLRNDYRSFVGQFYVPNDHTLVEYGLLVSEEDQYIDFDTEDTDRLQGEKFVGATNEFLMSVPENDATTVRAYLITKDGEENLHKTLSPFGPIETESYTETFAPFEGSGTTYVTETFTGDSGVEWTATEVRKNLGGYDIDGGGIMVRVPGTIEGTLPNGLSKLSLDVRMGFTGGSPEDRTIEIHANDEKVGSHTLSSETEIETLTLDDLTLNGPVDLRIQAAGGSGRQITLNNLEWRGYYAKGIHEPEPVIDTTDILIYEIYPGGGNNDAIYNQKYTVLYNTTQEAINLDGKSIQYASSSSTNFNNRTNLSGTIYPGTYFLIGMNKDSIGDDLPINTNMESSISPAMAGGHLAIADTTDPISGIEDEAVIDFVGYGSADHYQGDEPAPRGHADTSIRRVDKIDTFDNANDFEQRTVDLTYVEDHLEIDSISVSSAKRFFEVGEDYAAGNGRVILHYNNGSRASISLEETMVSGFDTSVLGAYTYTVEYEGHQTTVEYEVIDYEDIDNVEVHYIDVGLDASPGDAMLIKIGDIELLVDAGNNTSSDIANLLGFLEDHVDDGTIEYILPSHPHADHIGGYPAVFDEYDVGNVFMYCYEDYGTVISDTFEGLVGDMPEENVFPVCDLFNGSDIYTYDVVPGVTLEFYDHGDLETGSANEASVVFTLDALDTRLLFTGDAYTDQEEVFAPLAGNIDVLKMGHHGSTTSTGQTLVETIMPEVAIANVNILDNTYGHPHYAAVANLYEYSNASVYALGGGPASYGSMHQRNGTITVTITDEGYTLSAEYPEEPIELSTTDYWQSGDNPYNDIGYEANAIDYIFIESRPRLAR